MEQADTSALIEQILKWRPMTLRELALEAEMPEEACRREIARLRENSTLINLGDEKFSLWFIPEPAVLARIVRALATRNPSAARRRSPCSGT